MIKLNLCELCKKQIKWPIRSEKYPFKVSKENYSRIRFCSKECRYKNHSTLIFRERNRGWKGGIPKCLDCNIQLTSYGRTRCRKCYVIFNRGENNPLRKETLTYKHLHMVIRKELGNPISCKHCGKIGEKVNGRWNIEWANKTGNYLRVHSDWLALCKSCHRIYDIKNKLIKNYSPIF